MDQKQSCLLWLQSTAHPYFLIPVLRGISPRLQLSGTQKGVCDPKDRMGALLPFSDP